jgi:hypothetical protein
MQMLAVTCQVLYDNDLLDKQNELVKIKKELNDNILPKILYENFEEWETLKTEAINICKEGVRSFISDGEYRFMRDFGINPGQYDGLYLILWEAFNKISKGQANEWVSNYAQIINLTIKNTIKTLVDMGLWENIFVSLGREGLNTFILKIMMEFFDELSSDTYDSIACIRHFKCSNCDKITDYSDDNVKCWDCSPDSDD